MSHCSLPMLNVNITQKPNDAFSHRGSISAFDNAGKDEGIEDVYAPYDATVVWKDTGSAKTAILIVNDHEEECPMGVVKAGLIKTLTYHDNDTSNLWVGKKIKKGEVYYQEGTAGHATGNHVHFNVGLGKFDGKVYNLNEYGVWEIRDEIDPTKIFFLDEEHVIINDGGMKWVKYKEEEYIPSIIVKPIEEEYVPITTRNSIKYKMKEILRRLKGRLY